MDDRLDGLSESEKRNLLARLLKEQAERESLAAKSDRFPQSVGQQGLWFAAKREPNQTASNVFFPSRFRSHVDLESLHRAIDALADRHDALRTVFLESDDGQPLQRVLDSLPPEFKVIAMPGASDAEIRAQMRHECLRPFDLSEGPLLRIICFQVAADDVVVLATTHHIIVDFWSLVLMMGEVDRLYSIYSDYSENPDLHSKSPAPGHRKLPDAVCNYQTFVAQQRRWLDSKDAQRSLRYWTEQLHGISLILQLPTDFHRPAQFTHRAGVHPISIDYQTTQQIVRLARQLGVTENTIVLSLVQVVLARFSGQQTFAIGMPFSGRSNRDFESTIGFFVNMLPIVADVSSNPSLERLAQEVGKSLVAALSNERMPFAEIVKAVGVARDHRYHPLFQASCTFEKSQVKSEVGRAAFLLAKDEPSTQASTTNFAGLRQSTFPIDHPTCHYDLEFVFEFGESNLQGMICYCADLFDPSTVDSIAKSFVRLVERLVYDPSLPVLDVPLVDQVVCDRPAEMTDGCSLPTTISDLFRDSQHPLVTEAREFAHALVQNQVSPGEIIPVCMPKSKEAWIAIVGVMLAGAIPVPIDTDQPAVGLDVLNRDAGVEAVVCDANCDWIGVHDVRVIDPHSRERDERSLPDPSPDQPAYVIYTSGSTGNPKGVVVPHRAITNTLRWRQKTVELCDDDRVLVLLSHQFDAAMGIVLSTVHQNATPVWSNSSGSVDLDQLIDQLHREKITVLPAVPSLQSAIVAHHRFASLRSLRQIWCGGETLTHDLVNKIRRSFTGLIWNFYGPTEAAVEATAMLIDGSIDERGPIPIGRAIDGVDVRIFDACHTPLPAGAIGEIAISGTGLATGYLNRPELTKQAFIHSNSVLDEKGQPKRFYLTGDRGRKLANGAVVFLGREDHQVKVAGYRIELEEIERQIEFCEGVRKAAVVVSEHPATAGRLVAFVELEKRKSIAELQRELKQTLPAYKRPKVINAIERMPIGTSGKVRRRDLVLRPLELNTELLAPRSDLERYLCEQFCEQIGIDSLGIDDNFFEVGATSLDAAMLASRLSRELTINVPSALLFEESDVRSIACRLVQLYPKTIRSRFGMASIDLSQPIDDRYDAESLIVPLNTGNDRPALYMIHPPGGIVLCYRELSQHIDAEQPLVAIRSRGLYGDEPLPKTLDLLAVDYADQIERHQPEGPVVLGGWSLGGVFAFEVARQLLRREREVIGLVLLDSTVPAKSDPDGPAAGEDYGLEMTLEQLGELTPEEQLPFLYEHAQRLGVLEESQPAAVVRKVIEDLQRLFAHHVGLCRDHVLNRLDLPCLLLRPAEVPVASDPRPDRGWGQWTGNVILETISGHHHSMIQGEGAREIAASLSRNLPRFVASIPANS
ncbi:non-ribosomal peptide synthetase [Roseiconus lacunae]|uniref:non-ribosomal peptide synthetase n=1 Tax=Roseiconus lacunae TaxID=2605694 RepID=UPI0011F18CC2|nr:non-ribosomal peptide synthetase [Roseiconus lacunae]